MMRRGYSRDHRPDCEQLVLALIVNNEGFPFSYEIFDGNRVNVSTMEAILRTSSASTARRGGYGCSTAES
jgi:transposase